MADRQSVLEATYLMYQLDWLKSHTSAQEVMDEVAEWYDENEWSRQNPKFADEAEPVRMSGMQERIEERGVGGQCYVCMSEFEGCEFTDAPYMERLLEGYENLLRDWREVFEKDQD